jgi:SAM-dependent methyltransferase
LAVGAQGASCAACGAFFTLADGILRLTVGREGTPGYDPHFFGTLSEVERRHFWFVGRREIVLDALRRAVPDLARRRLFDIGSGSGGLLEFLSASGVALAGACDAYEESLALLRRRMDVPLVLVDEGHLPPLGAGHDLLALFDVLEHMDDDVGTLRFLASVLRPGGVLVLTVPAHPALWGEMDEDARHRRRYTRSGVRERLRLAGLEIRLLSHFMSPLLPLLVLTRGVGRRLPGRWRRWASGRGQAELRVVPLLNGFLRALLSIERRLIRHMQMPFGSSIVAVAGRPEGRA